MDITSCNLLKLFLVSYSLKVSYMKDKPSVYAGENKEELPDEDTSEGRKKMEFIMKLSKLILTTLAAAAVIGFAGCKGDDEDQHDILNISGDTASVCYTNTSAITYRGFRTLKTKHTDAVAVFTLGDAAEDASDRTGVFGFVFDLQKNKNATDANNAKKTVYDFTAVSLRKNGDAVQCYVSRFEGVDPNQMDGGNNFKDVEGEELTTTGKTIGNHTAKETVILKGSSGAYATITPPNDGWSYSNGGIQVAVEVKANNDSTYTVKFYDSTAVSKIKQKMEEIDEEGNGQTVTIKTGQIEAGATTLSFTGDSNGESLTVPASWTTDNQQKMGFYAAVYPGKTLVGSLRLPYILNEDEVVEWED